MCSYIALLFRCIFFLVYSAGIHARQEYLSLSFHPLGYEFVCGSNDHAARVYDIRTKTLLAVLYGHKGEVGVVQYSHDGEYVHFIHIILCLTLSPSVF